MSIFLVSAGTLTFEVILTRVFALAYWHHFAALLIALALTGFGAAGSLISLWMPTLARRPKAALAGTALAAAVAMPLSYLAILAVKLEPLALAWAASAWIDLALVCAILVIPFLLAAAHIGLILAWAEKTGPAYASNLAGSAFGCLVAALLQAHVTPNAGLYPAAGLVALGGIFQLGRRFRMTVALGAGMVALALAVQGLLPLPLRFEPFKARSVALAAYGGELKYRSVGLRGLVEVIGGPAFHFAPGLTLSCQEDLPPQEGLFIDGDLVGAVTRMEAAQTSPAFADCMLARLPYAAFRPQNVLVVNPEGGLALLPALRQGVPKIVGVEENPQIVHVMTKGYPAYTGGLYARPNVEVVTDDPGAFLARTVDRFDLIVLGHGGNWESGGGSGLSQARLLTVEGVQSMLGRLSPNGALAVMGPILTPPRASLKLIATLAEALRRFGADPESSLAVARDWGTVLILAKPAGLTTAETGAVRNFCRRGAFDLAALPDLSPDETNRFHHMPGDPIALAARLALSGRFDELYETSFFNLRPATRDRPYFFDFFRFETLRLILNPRAGAPLAVTDWGLLFNWGALAAALTLAAMGILPPLFRLGRRSAGLAWFALLGLGYMLAEITLMADLIYRLGRPALAVPLTIGVFLAASGLGSRVWGDRPPRRFFLASALLLPAALLGLRLLPPHPVLLGLCLVPAAVVMGIPFAGGLTHLIGPDPASRGWAYGVNGFFSVAGSLAAGLVGLSWGHSAALALACLCYLGAAAMAKRKGEAT